MQRKIDRIQKRDGRLVAYEEPRIAAAIHRAGQAAGTDARTLAEDLAGVVTLYLERYHEGGVPTSIEVRRIVERILNETGHPAIARAFASHVAAPAVAAAPAPPELFPATSLLVEGHRRGEVSRWDRGRIAAALQKEARLDAERAGQIALAVEQRILSMNPGRVSTSMIRELVNLELMGARGELLSQIVVGLPKYDLAQMVSAPGRLPDTGELTRRVGEAALQQFALQEIFSPDVTAAHLEGRLHIHRLEHPTKLYWLAPDLEELRRGGLGDGAPAALRRPAADARALTALLTGLVRQESGHVSEGLELPMVNLAYAAASPEGGLERELDYLTAELPLPARLGVGIGYLPPASQPQREWIERAERAARGAAARLLEAPGLTVFVAPQAFRTPEDQELLRRACARPPVRFVLGRGARPPVSRFGAVLAQAVTINLPQAVYRAGGETGLDAELERVVELVVRAHLDKRRLLKRFTSAEGLGHGLGDPAQFRYAVGVCGLAEAVRLLRGEGLADGDESARAAFRVLSYLFALLRQASDIHGIALSLEELDGAEAIERFERIDAQIYPTAHDLGPTYTPGTHVEAGGRAGPAERIRVESRFHTLVASGSVRLRAAAGDAFSHLMRLQAETLTSHVLIVED